MSSEVPEGWQISSVEDLLTPDCLFSDGDWVESKDQDPAGTNRLLQLADIGDGRFVNKSNRFMNDEQFNRLNCTQLQEGDVLIARMPEPIGRACILPRLDNRLATVVDIAILRPSAVDSYWLMSVINSAGFRTKIEEQSSGTTRTRIGRTALSKIKLLSPPLPEQKKIASILTSVDEVIENTQKQIDKLQDLKKATMNELLTKGIGHTEFKDSELGRIPKSWEIVTLRDICKVRQGLQIPIAERFNQGGESRYPYLTVAWINSNFDANKAEFIGNPSKSVVLKSDEFVVGRTGAVGQIFDGLKCVFHNNFFAVSLLHTSVEKEFLKHFLKWHLTQDLLLKLAGSTTIPDLNHGDFYSVNLRLPAPEEQQRIIRVLDHFDLEISTREKKLHQTQSLKKSLMQDLLTGKVRVTVN
jgi:type I restriction enzyme, S subunit